MKYINIFIAFFIVCCSITSDSTTFTNEDLYILGIDTTSFDNYFLIKARNKQLQVVYLFSTRDIPNEKGRRIELKKTYSLHVKRYSYDKDISLKIRSNSPNQAYIDDEYNIAIWSNDSLEQVKINGDIGIYYALNVKNMFILE